MPVLEESTRDRLLDAAETLFGDRGFDGVGIREIAESAGVNLSGIKYHFGSKHGLYLETIRRSMDRHGSTAAWAILERPIATREEAALALQAFMRAFLRVLLVPGESDCACLIMQSALHPGESTDLVVREFIKPHHERLCMLVGALDPGSTVQGRVRGSQVVMALLLHQYVCRPFLERLDAGESFEGDTDKKIDRLACELAGFVLRGIDCADLIQAIRPPGGPSKIEGDRG